MSILILILGALLRLYNSTAMALWHDEAFSALYMRYGWEEMFYRIGLDVHPPLYYIILRAWTAFAGDSLFALRLLSIVFGAATVWAGYLFVKAAFKNKPLAQISALLLAINPFQIQFALEARMYTLGTFLLAGSSYLLVRALESENHAKKYWLGYALATAASLYTHYYLLFSIAAQGLFVILYFWKNKQGKHLAGLSLSYLLAFLLFLPWLPTLAKQIMRVKNAFWIPGLAWWSVPDTLWKMLFGGTVAGHPQIIIGSILTIWLVIHFVKRIHNFQKWHVLLAVAVPLVGAVILSWRSNIFLYRYFVFAGIYFAILVGIGLYYIPKAITRWILISVLIAGMVFSSAKNWRDLDLKNSPGMAAASKIINNNAKIGDEIVVGWSFVYFTFRYYNETDIRPRLLSDRPLAEIPHFSGTAILTDEDLVLGLDKIPKNKAVWLIWTTGFTGSKPAVPKNWQQLDEKKFGDAPDFKGDIYITKYKT